MLRHVCFNASVFALPVKIHAADIKSVLPKSNFFLPNSIEIIENNGGKHFFTSFLSRERCLELIISRWQTELARAEDNVPMAEQQAEAEAGPSGSGDDVAGLDHHRSQSVSMRRRGWPVTTRPPPDPAEIASNGWTNVLDQTLQGWEVLDVVQVFEEGDAFLREWHESLGDTDLEVGKWRLGEGEDRERDLSFTARIHDPPLGGSRTVKVVMKQSARLHSDGSFSLDIHNTMPLITVAKFRVEFLWRVSQAGGRAHVLVWVRTHFLKPSFLRATISNQSVSQGISCYTQLRQRLMLRFPPQGSGPEERDHVSDIAFALRLAKDAAARMPRAWQEHLLSTLSKRPTVRINVFGDLMRWASTATTFVLVALLATFIVLPSVNFKLLPPHAALREHFDALTATVQLGGDTPADAAAAEPAPPQACPAGAPLSCQYAEPSWEPHVSCAGEERCRAGAEAEAGAGATDCTGACGCARGSNGSAWRPEAASLVEETSSSGDPAAAVIEQRGGGTVAAERAGEASATSGYEADRDEEGGASDDEIDEIASDDLLDLQLLQVVRRERRLLEAVARRRQQARAAAAAAGELRR